MLERALGGDINVVMKFGDNLWPVEVDIGEMELAILNLCLNARDAMADGGTIRSRPRTLRSGGTAGAGIREAGGVRFRHRHERRRCRTSVRPFFTTKDVGKGSGLGLAQVYGFAQQSSGRVTIDSEVGKGTTVTVMLPRSPGHLPRRRNPASATEPRQRRTHVRQGHVLLVEDDREVAALTREMLNSLGFSVIHVASAEAALGALANERTIDLVLSDIMMPGDISGLELAREIRVRRPALPVLLATGYQEAAAGAAKDGIGVLLKPYSMEELASAISAQLNARRT